MGAQDDSGVGTGQLVGLLATESSKIITDESIQEKCSDVFWIFMNPMNFGFECFTQEAPAAGTTPEIHT